MRETAHKAVTERNKLIKQQEAAAAAANGTALKPNGGTTPTPPQTPGANDTLNTPSTRPASAGLPLHIELPLKDSPLPAHHTSEMQIAFNK